MLARSLSQPLRVIPCLLAAAGLWGCSSTPPSNPAAHQVGFSFPSTAVSGPEVRPAPAPVTAPTAAVPAVYGAEVASRFPDPPVSYRTPAFQGARDAFTSNAELQGYVRALARDGLPLVLLVPAGMSQGGVTLEALLFTRNPDASPAGLLRSGRPTVLLMGQQHGDEPAGAEALLVLAQELAHGSLQILLDRINVLILPRANPDGAQTGQRTTANGIDANRDHLLLQTPEAQALATLVREYQPVVVVDAHEYSPTGVLLQQFGMVQRYDALLQYAMTPNLPPFFTKASEEWFRQPLLARLKETGLTQDWYYTAASDNADKADKKLAMGSTQADTGRNVNGLKNAVSFLIETRGTGLGHLHLKRRVYTHVTAMTSILKSAADRAADLVKLKQYVDADVSAQACQGQAVIDSAPTETEYDLRMLNPVTGVDVDVTVTWDSSLVLQDLKSRARPCGYWLAADQADAVSRLRSLGVQVNKVSAVGVVQGETYVGAPPGASATANSHGASGGAAAPKDVRTVATLLDVPAGSYYVSLAQPLANLVIAALEPDSPAGFANHHVITSVARTARVTALPNIKLSALP